MKKTSRKINSSKGFSLLELMIAIAISVMIMMVVGAFQANTFKYNQYSSSVISSAQDASSILRTIVKELRSAKPGSNGSYPIATAATSTIIFYSDINSDGLVDQVRYFISGTKLMKGVISPTGSPLTYVAANEVFTTLASDVRNGTSTSLFEYFDSTYNGTTTPLVQPVAISVIRLVRVNLYIDADPSKAPIARIYTSDATLRNLKDNL